MRPEPPGHTRRSPHRRVIYLETLDPLLDADHGEARAGYRIQRDLPWVFDEGWEVERWGLWRAGAARHDSLGRRRGPVLPSGFRARTAFAVPAWGVHFFLALRRPRAGLAVAYNPFAGVGVAAAAVLRRSPPLLVRVIARIASKAAAVHGSPARARLLDRVEGFVLRRCHLVVPMGSFTRELARRAGADDARIVDLPNPTRWFSDAVPAAARDDRRVVAAGRLAAEKGFDVLLAAFAELGSDDGGAVLDVAGDGPLRPALERFATDLGIAGRVRFHGWLPAEAMGAFFSGAAVAVLPSRVEEGLGMVLVEAGLAGCALIGSDLGGIRDVVRPGQTGLLVPPDDPPALAAALRRLLSDPEETRRLGAGAEAVARDYLDLRAPALATLRERVEQLLADRNPGGVAPRRERLPHLPGRSP